MEVIHLTIDEDTLTKYEEYYFSIHKRAKKKPIAHPYHESMNSWMIMTRQAMNNLKQRWKDFTIWFVTEQGYADRKIEKCELCFKLFFPTKRRHDPDNYSQKFFLDGLVESGMIIDDDCNHIKKITTECFTGDDNPRTEITINVLE